MIKRPHVEALIETAAEAGMDVGLNNQTKPFCLYLTWKGKSERINEIAIRDTEASMEAGAHILTNWIENRKEGAKG